MSRELKFTIGDKVIVFKVGEFNDIDIDKLLKIDYENLFAEIITFPVVVNRLGLLAADMDNEFQLAKLNLSIYESKRKKELRESLVEYDEKGKAKKVVQDEVDSALEMDKIWKIKKSKMIEIQKQKEYMYTIYTSAKDKSEKLNKLSLGIKTGDIDEKIIQNQLNNVYFKIKQGRIKDAD